MRAMDLWLFATLAIILASGPAGANGKAEHDRRVAADIVRLFESLDRDADRTVTRTEAAGALNFLPLFADIDINRDGQVTSEDLSRYLLLAHAVSLETVSSRSSVASSPLQSTTPVAPTVSGSRDLNPPRR